MMRMSVPAWLPSSCLKGFLSWPWQAQLLNLVRWLPTDEALNSPKIGSNPQKSAYADRTAPALSPGGVFDHLSISCFRSKDVRILAVGKWIKTTAPLSRKQTVHRPSVPVTDVVGVASRRFKESSFIKCSQT